MRFAILGPVEVSIDGRLVSLAGPKQRALLAVLLLHANEVVSRDRLIDALWGERPPPSAAESLDAYVYRLRRLLGHDRLPRHAAGYVLRVEPDELDAERFEHMVASAGEAAAAGDAANAARRLTDALALWRGPALADVLYEPFACAQARQLEELRLGALEQRIEAELVMGRGVELVPELEQLVLEHHLRERLLGALMLALYRAGRQADALVVFRAARHRLVEELGLEPGAELRELERRILQHDPTLAAPRPFAVARSPRARRTLLAAVALAVGAGVTAGLMLSSGAAHTPPALAAGVGGLLGVNNSSSEVATATALTGAPGALGTGAGSVWVADASGGTVSRVDPVSGVVVDRILVGGEPGSVVSGDGAIWVASTLGATVQRIDPTTESVTQTIALGGANADAIAFGQGRLWVADSSARSLFEIDPAAGSLRRTLPVDLRPSAVALAAGAIWVAGYDSATVEKIDPSSGRTIARVHVGNGPVALAFGADALWVANSLDATVTRIDPATLAVRATIPVGSGPSAIASGAGSVWVANQYSASVSRIDPHRNQVASALDVGGRPTALTMGMGRLWAGVAANGDRHRGGTLVMLTTSSLASVDPAFYNNVWPPQFIGLAYDTLVTFQHSTGSGGLRLVPDLALATPTPSDGGSAYAFHLRPRIRYSDGRVVLASDFRRAIERLFRVGSPGSDYYAPIVGAGTCTRRPASCDLSHGIVTDDAAGTVIFHLTAPDPEFLFKLTEEGFSAPIPPGTPDHDTGSNPPPGTGPYRIVHVDNTEVRFARNPFFREWSNAAQPDGNPDAIIWRYASSEQEAVTAIQQGQADWLNGPIPPAQDLALQTQSPVQLHLAPQFAVDFVHLNTHRAPFNDVRVRRALNYAIDRNRIAQMYGGPSFATPACQPLAPGLPGYRRYCPYTLHPSADGKWPAPDPARAARLINASGTRGERVEVWGATDLVYPPQGVPAYIAGVLRSLGYRVHLHLAPFATITVAMRRRHQLSVDGDWGADYPDPSSYIPQFFSCGGGNGNGYYCDPSLDRKMREVSQLELQDPAKATALWTTIDHQLTDNAGWVPTVNPRAVELVSKRLRNYQYNPIWGFLADQSWLR